MGLFSYNIEKYSPKQLVIIPMVLLAISLVVLAFVTVTVGMPVKPGIDFSGGTAVTVITPDTSDQIRTLFADYPLVSISEGLSNGKFITFATMDDAKYKSLTTLIASKYPDAQVDQIGESFGKTLQDQAFIAMILAFIGMAIVVFVSFRTFVPSCAVVLSAFADMVNDCCHDECCRYPSTARDHRGTAHADRLFRRQRHIAHHTGAQTAGKT